METIPTYTTDRFVTIAVDVQNDFLPGGALAVTNGHDVIPPLNDLMHFTRQRDGLVVATGDQHPAVTPHFADYGGPWPVHCVQNTEGAAFDPLLDIDDQTIIINKGTGQTDGYSGYEGRTQDGRTIEQIVQPKHPTERVIVAIGGLATDYCVRNTVLDATKQADRVAKARTGAIAVYALTDAMRAVNIHPTDEAEALQDMQAAGATLLTTAEFMERYQ